MPTPGAESGLQLRGSVLEGGNRDHAGAAGGLERFARIAEIVDADDERRRLGRERFKAYRELKLPLETHQLDDTADA